jgi:hypothetical protein
MHVTSNVFRRISDCSDDNLLMHIAVHMLIHYDFWGVENSLKPEMVQHDGRSMVYKKLA